MRDGEKEEPVARAAKELQGSSKSVEWSLSNGLLYFWGKIYVLDTSNLHRQIIALSHNSRLAGRSRGWKTLELVSQSQGMLAGMSLPVTCAFGLNHSSNRRTPPSSHSIHSMGYHQHKLHCQAATICRAQFHHGCCQFHHKACTFHFHCH